MSKSCFKILILLVVGTIWELEFKNLDLAELADPIPIEPNGAGKLIYKNGVNPLSL